MFGESSGCPATPIQLAIIVVLVLTLMAVSVRFGFALGGGAPTGEPFTSKKAVELHQGLSSHFEGGGTTYSQAKATVPGLDPVVYNDARANHSKGGLTPEAVQRSLE